MAVGLAHKILPNLANVLVKDPMRGLKSATRSIEIDLFLIIEYGLRITTVAQSCD